MITDFEKLEAKIPNFEQVLEKIQNSFSSNILNTSSYRYGYSLYFILQEPQSDIAGVPDIYYKNYKLEVDLEGIVDVNNLNNSIILKDYVESSFNYEVKYNPNKGIILENGIMLKDIINPKLKEYFINVLVDLNTSNIKKRIELAIKREKTYIELRLYNEYAPIKELAERLEKEGFIYNKISDKYTTSFIIYIKK